MALLSPNPWFSAHALGPSHSRSGLVNVLSPGEHALRGGLTWVSHAAPKAGLTTVNGMDKWFFCQAHCLVANRQRFGAGHVFQFAVIPVDVEWVFPSPSGIEIPIQTTFVTGPQQLSAARLWGSVQHLVGNAVCSGDLTWKEKCLAQKFPRGATVVFPVVSAAHDYRQCSTSYIKKKKKKRKKKSFCEKGFSNLFFFKYLPTSVSQSNLIIQQHGRDELCICLTCSMLTAL